MAMRAEGRWAECVADAVEIRRLLQQLKKGNEFVCRACDCNAPPLFSNQQEIDKIWRLINVRGMVWADPELTGQTNDANVTIYGIRIGNKKQQ